MVGTRDPFDAANYGGDLKSAELARLEAMKVKPGLRPTGSGRAKPNRAERRRKEAAARKQIHTITAMTVTSKVEGIEWVSEPAGSRAHPHLSAADRVRDQRQDSRVLAPGHRLAA